MKETVDLEGLIVLIVEDEPLLRLFIVDEMIERGWQVHEAADAIEALVILDLHKDIELVLTDVHMPGMDGIELSHIIHARWPEILLMISSAHWQLKLNELPPDARFLAKPIDLAAMVSEMRDMIAKHGRRG